jgi:hypothetical protein
MPLGYVVRRADLRQRENAKNRKPLLDKADYQLSAKSLLVDAAGAALYASARRIACVT